MYFDITGYNIIFNYRYNILVDSKVATDILMDGWMFELFIDAQPQ